MEKLAKNLIQATEKYELFDLVDNLKAENSKEYGPFLVFKRLFKELGMQDLLEKHLGNLNTDFDLIESLFNLILNRFFIQSWVV